MLRHALVAFEALYTRLTPALAAQRIACEIDRTERVAFAVHAALAGLQVPERVPTLVALTADHVRSAFACAVAEIAFGAGGTEWRTGACVALELAQRVAPVTWQTRVAPVAGRVVRAAQTLAREAVAVAHRVLVYVAVAVASFACEAHFVVGHKVAVLA